MKSFLKFTLATFVALSIFGMIFLFVIMGIVGSASNKEPFVVKDNSILKLELSNEIVDRATENPLENLNIQAMKVDNKIGLNILLKQLFLAKTDDNIKGIYLDLTAIPAGVATMEEIRDAILDFKTSGKFVIAYADYYTQKTYYLASAADKVYVNPEGLVELKGLNAEVMFYTEALQKIGVEPIIIRHGKFKSAVEPFMYTSMSDANKEQTSKFIGTIWNNILDGVSKSRNISIDELNRYANEMLITDAKSSLKYKLVDGLKYKDEVLTELGDSVKVKDFDDINFVSLGDYKDAIKFNPDRVPTDDKIAIIYATGEINMGEGSNSEIGSDGISEQIRIARKDSTVKAIVLRVNSPGGSALASDIIWREMILAKAVKPVVVSMGDVAASGGYYISCPANKIFASKNTITGSIGVFGLMWNGTELMNNIGIHTDGIKTNDHADIGSTSRPMTEDEKAVIQKSVEDIYGTFIGHVGEGRGMKTADVDSIGQGRVWSGVNAIEIGLIDEFGGLKAAVEEAAKLAKLENYKLEELPKQKDFMEELFKELTGEAKASILQESLGASYRYYNGLNKILNTKGVQARVPYEIEVY